MKLFLLILVYDIINLVRRCYEKRVIIIISIILVITLIIVSLVIYNNNKIERELNEAKELYLVYLSGSGFLGNKNKFQFYDERIITKIYNLNGKMLIINEFDILSINGTEVTMLDNIHDEETLLYYQDENGDNYIFDIDNQILMSVDLKDDYSYEVKEELDITNLIQSSYDFINNVETFYGLDTNNNVMIMDSDNNTIKQFELNMKSNDLVYGIYRVK